MINVVRSGILISADLVKSPIKSGKLRYSRPLELTQVARIIITNKQKMAVVLTFCLICFPQLV